MERLTDFEKRQMKNSIIKQGLPARTNNSTWQRKLIASVAIFVFGISAFGFSFPALAQHIPLIGGFFARMEVLDGGRFSTIAEYATMVGEIQVADGVSITLVEQLFDGRGIYLSYLIESETALNRELQWFEYTLTREVTVTIDGEVLPIAFGDGGGMPYMFWIDDYSFFFMFNIPLIQGESPRLSEIVANATEIEVMMNFLEFGVGRWNHTDDQWRIDVIATGPWEFRLPIDRSELTRIPLYMWFDNEIVDYGMLSLTVTPNRFIINYGSWVGFDQLIFESEQSAWELSELWRLVIDDWTSLDSIITIEWQVIDNTGKEMTVLQRNHDHYTGFSALGTIHLLNDGLMREQLVVTPIVSVWSVVAENGLLQTGELLSRTELEPVVINLP